MEIKIPQLALVLLIGPSGSGKSSFARKFFKRTEIVSSDECRALVSDEENNQSATNDAFDLLHFLIGKRLKRGLLTVIDATNVEASSRKSLIELAKTYHVLPVAIVFDLPEAVCQARNTERSDRNFGAHVIRHQKQSLRKSLGKLKFEGFRGQYILRSEEEVNAVQSIVFEKLYTDKSDELGPFDIIGDVHGCISELKLLLQKLDYQIETVEIDKFNFGYHVIAPESRRVIFVGDLVDRGPDSPEVLKLAMSMVNSGVAYCVPGNHDLKLQKFLAGKKVQLNHGLEKTVEQLEAYDHQFKRDVERFLYGLISHFVFDRGKLVVAHAGMREEMQGRGSAAVRAFALYGETSGEIDEFGLPVRHNWAMEYRGKAKVVYGHTPVPKAEWLNNTIDIDTGCVFGGKLTALRYPEEELLSVDARATYCEPIKPLEKANSTEINAQHAHDDLLDISDVIGKRIVQTRLRNNITIREENAIAALEVMSRWAINPKWLIYLPPTMSPCETSDLPNFLEYPTQALNYYKKRHVNEVICEKKHMGSRAIVVICKDEATALARFGVANEGIGTCYTRTGRSFFNNESDQAAFLERFGKSLESTGFWGKFETDWACFDCELMPWSAKAQALLVAQYASVGAAARTSIPKVQQELQKAMARGIEEAGAHLNALNQKYEAVQNYIAAYQNYCWNVSSIDDYKLAPFHILATEGNVHSDKTHAWHLENIAAICAADPKWLLATEYKLVDLNSPDAFQEVCIWWEELTKTGGEGMVVKPNDFVVFRKEGLLQPAIKCRGKEYLRIIYGPEYDFEANLIRLKKRGLSRKQGLALREFALGIEGLERFVRKEPLRKVHESIFGVLALESEAVDPRL